MTSGARFEPVPINPDRIDAALIDEPLVRALVTEQFPRWTDLPLRFIEHGGNDHRMFRLGDELCVRLPSAPGYVPQVEKEQTWLPRLAPQLPLPIPAVRGVGRPSELFRAPWSIYGWLDGIPATTADVRDDTRFAADLAGFLVALQEADTTGAPGAGLHSAYRGGPLEHYNDETHDLLPRLRGRERDLAEGLWRDALSAPFTGPAVWVHGDVAVANLLMRDGELSAVLDFGCAAVGDPACDTGMRWAQFAGLARNVFTSELRLDEATWARGRGWALWKALILIGNRPPAQQQLGRHVLDQLFAGA